MNYYEELGLGRSASADQIRQAYKHLARWLHPDQHQDEQLRLLAECQMKRLNEVVAVLTDAGRRRRYDLSLDREARGGTPVVVAPERRLALANGVWLLAGCAALAGILWYSSGASPPRARASRPAPVATARAASPDLGKSERRAASPQAAQLERRLAEARAERDAALRELARRPRAEPALPNPEPAHPTVETRAGLDEATAVERSIANVLESGLVGTWFYNAARNPVSAGDLYPPEYIELVVAKEAGSLVGRYRARYIIPDRAISPHVTFDFQGPFEQGTALLHWTLGSSAKGEVQLRLLSRNSLEVSWWATRLGKGMGLASGTAILIRRNDGEEQR